MTGPSAAPGSSALGTPEPTATRSEPSLPGLERVVEALTQLADDALVPRNVRRGAQAAKDALSKPRAALDMRIASAVYVLDDLANDPNLPTHGRTAIWSIISSLESLQ
ncbi:MAG TPA: UPF0147 family protein [Thermoplasmata archaeon]|nr:UPF0147 family protein [Thermoplasmata archaeon]